MQFRLLPFPFILLISLYHIKFAHRVHGIQAIPRHDLCNIISRKLLQSSNAELPILVTPSGIVMLVKLLQPEKALYPMDVTPSGIVILVKPLQSSNAELPILVTLSGITNTPVTPNGAALITVV